MQQQTISDMHQRETELSRQCHEYGTHTTSESNSLSHWETA